MPDNQINDKEFTRKEIEEITKAAAKARVCSHGMPIDAGDTIIHMVKWKNNPNLRSEFKDFTEYFVHHIKIVSRDYGLK